MTSILEFDKVRSQADDDLVFTSIKADIKPSSFRQEQVMLLSPRFHRSSAKSRSRRSYVDVCTINDNSCQPR